MADIKLAVAAAVTCLALSLRSVSGPGVTARRIGIREIVYGALTVALIAAGHVLGR
jgi:hypothetical protein